MKERVVQVALDLQHTLHTIGANAELLSMDLEGMVWSRIKGHCTGNLNAQTLFQDDVKQTLKNYVSEIKTIEAIVI